MEHISNSFNTSASDNSNNDSGRDSKNHKLVEEQALRIVDKLGRSPDSNIMPFYYKVCYKLSEARISTLLEVALSGRNPAKYFSFLASKEIGLGQFRDNRSEDGR